MDLTSLLKSESLILGEGSIYELLRRHPEVEFDAEIAHGGLIYNSFFSEVLEKIVREYFDIAIAHQYPMVISAATWRCNRERLENSGFPEKSVNQDNIAFLRRIKESYSPQSQPILIGGTIGPKGDAYKPEEAPDQKEAEEFHFYQVDALASARPDFIQAATLPALGEAMGMAKVMAQTGLPYIISFVVTKDGTLLDGTLLAEAIHAIDDNSSEATARFAVNCVHPSVLHSALDKNPSIQNRIIGFHGNTSPRSVDELVDLEELETEDPDSFAAAISNLVTNYPIPIIGGCCGTNPAHIASIARALHKK